MVGRPSTLKWAQCRVGLGATGRAIWSALLTLCEELESLKSQASQLLPASAAKLCGEGQASPATGSSIWPQKSVRTLSWAVLHPCFGFLCCIPCDGFPRSNHCWSFWLWARNEICQRISYFMSAAQWLHPPNDTINDWWIYQAKTALQYANCHEIVTFLPLKKTPKTSPIKETVMC